MNDLWGILERRVKEQSKYQMQSTDSMQSLMHCNEFQPVHPKADQSWVFIGRTDAEADFPILWPPDTKRWLIRKDTCWERLKAGGEGDDRGWDGWMASPTQWTCIWVNSWRWWRTGKPGVLQSMGSQRVRRDWETEQQQIYKKSDLISSLGDKFAWKQFY